MQTSHVMHRNLRYVPQRAVGGDGIYLVGEDGRHYLDACSGAAVSNLGHQHPGVLDAMHRQLDQLAYAHTGFFTTEAAEALADFLAQRAPGDLNHLYLVSGGSEAVETGLKLARQYYVERGEPERRYFIARRQSYHGNTLGALSVGGNKWRRQQYEPLLMPVRHIAPCYAYRDKLEQETLHDYGRRVANELETAIEELGAKHVIGFVAEPVVGATLGAVPAVDGYFRRIREICDAHDILLIFDEVMCGMGRTGTLFAQQQEQVTADLTTIAKGLAAGYQPIGGVMVNEQIYNTIRHGSGVFQHGHTYSGHALAAATALGVQQIIENNHLLDNVQERGKQLFETLTSRYADHPFIGDIRGRGLFIGIEFVAEKKTKQPFPAEDTLHLRLQRTGMQHGLMTYPMPGTIDGKRGCHLLLAPPFIITPDEIDELVGRLDLVIKDIFQQ